MMGVRDVGRGTWIGIGVVIGIVAALALASVLPSISPGTAEAMHLLKVSTVTMPVYAGTRTVTATATATVTKYLGGKVITVTSTLTRTVTTTVTAMPTPLTTTVLGSKAEILACNEKACAGVAKLNLGNKTLYVLVKTVTRTITVPRSVKIVGGSIHLLWQLNETAIHDIIMGMVVNGSPWFAVVGLPTIPTKDLLYVGKERGLLVSLREMEYYLLMTAFRAAPGAIRVFGVEKGLEMVEKMLEHTVDAWSSAIETYRSHGFYVKICETTNPQDEVIGLNYCTVVVGERYVLAIPCSFASHMPAMLMSMKSLTKMYCERHKLACEIASKNPRLHVWPFGCINPISWSKARSQLEKEIQRIVEYLKLVYGG